MKDKHKAMTVRKSIFKRITSFFLAFMVAILCVPSNVLEAGAFWWGWGAPIISPNTITNASIKFKDEAANVITNVESGDPFSIVITISGSNVFQMMGGGKTEYTVEITDKNLLLTNFKDNGFFNGAKYNGYTLKYDEKTGKRTITFSIYNNVNDDNYHYNNVHDDNHYNNYNNVHDNNYHYIYHYNYNNIHNYNHYNNYYRFKG